MAAQLGISPGTYQVKRSSLQGRALIKAVREYIQDDKRLIELCLREEGVHAVNKQIEYRDLLEEAGDVEAAARINKSIIETLGLNDKAVGVSIDTGKVEIHVDSITDFLSTPTIPEADWEVDTKKLNGDPDDIS